LKRAEKMLITLEGGEGAGKTVAAGYLVSFLEKNGYDCLWTRQPGGTEIGQKIRGILLDSDNEELIPEAELLLYMADRTQHIKTLIEPALKAGKIVVCDRFTDSSVCYQGIVRGLGVDRVIKLHWAAGIYLDPDITFLLDLPAKLGLKRATDETRFEKEKLEFHEKIRKGFLEMPKNNPHRWVVVDVKKNNERQTAKIICSEVQKRFLKIKI